MQAVTSSTTIVTAPKTFPSLGRRDAHRNYFFPKAMPSTDTSQQRHSERCTMSCVSSGKSIWDIIVKSNKSHHRQSVYSSTLHVHPFSNNATSGLLVETHLRHCHRYTLAIEELIATLYSHSKEAEHCPGQRIQGSLRSEDTADLDPAGKTDPAGKRRQTRREKERRKKDRWKDLLLCGRDTQGGSVGSKHPKRSGSEVPSTTSSYGV